MSTTGKKYTKSTLRDVINIQQHVEQVLIKNEDGTVCYQPGWSDIRVAEVCGVRASQVGRVRSELYGLIRHKKEILPGSPVSIEDQLDDIRKRLTALENSGKLL